MKKIIHKIAGLALGLSLAMGVGVALSSHRDAADVRAADESVNFSEKGYSNQQEIANYSGSHFAITFSKGTNSNAPKYYTSGAAIRAYGGNTFTFTSSDTLTKIVLGYGSSDGSNAITTDVGSFSTNTWIGSSNNVVFTIGGTTGNRRLASATVTYSGGTVIVTHDVKFYDGETLLTDLSAVVQDGTAVSKPSDPTKTGYDFVGWFTDSGTLSNEYDFSTLVTADLNLYAKWTESSSGGESNWVLTNLSDLSSDDVFVIVGNNGNNYAMSNDNGTSSAPKAVGVTVSDDAITSEVADTIKWKLSGNATDGYTFYPSGSNANWLYCTNTNNGVRVGTNANKTFKINDGYLKHDGTSRYIGVYNSADWRCYTSINANIENQTFGFYKHVETVVGTQIKLSVDNIEMEYGDSPVSVVVKNADDLSQTITGCSFESNKPSVADVVNGQVVAYGKGTATITVTHPDDTSVPDNPITYKSTTFTVTVNKLDTIAELYTYASGTSVQFNGYYAGKYADGIVLMDGEYGMIMYKGASESTWEVDETIIHVSGSMTSYGGLIEVAEGATITALSGAEATAASAKLSKPTNHKLTAADATSTDVSIGSRRTFVAGVLKSITQVNTSGNYNVVVTVDNVDLALYLKKADNVEITLLDESTKTISEYLSEHVNENVTIKGFTSFYSNAFQVRVYDIVESSETYKVEDFAQTVLTETDKVCSIYDDDNKSRLSKTWGDLEESWNTLSATEKGKWQDTTTYTPNYKNNSESVVENALGRYNLLCKKYFSTNNFTGRSDVYDAPVTAQGSMFVTNNYDSNSSTIIVIVVAITSITSIGVLLVIKRRRSLVK